MKKFEISYAPELRKFFVQIDGAVIYFNNAKQVGKQVELATDFYIADSDCKQSVVVAYVTGNCDQFHSQMLVTHKHEVADSYEG